MLATAYSVTGLTCARRGSINNSQADHNFSWTAWGGAVR